MSKTAIISPELPPPVGPFSQAIEVGGFLYFSGQVGQDPATGKVVEGGIVAETERVFRNLATILKAAGRSFEDVARAGVYLTNISDFVAMNGVYAKHFSQPFPARTTIGVAALPLGARVESALVIPSGYASQEVASFIAQLDDLLKRQHDQTRKLTPADLEWQPAPGMNTIGMLMAHQAVIEVAWTGMGIEDLQRDQVRFKEILGIGSKDDGMPLSEDGAPPAALAGKDLAFYDDLLTRA